jgi:hypothetical protein
MSFLALLTLPFVLIESKGKIQSLEKQPKACYYNTDFNYSLKYPNGFTPVFDQKDKLVLKHPKTNMDIEVFATYGISDKDIYELSDLYLNPKQKGENAADVAFYIINGSQGEISYAMAEKHFFEKLYHLGNKMVKIKISAPLDQAYLIDELRTAIKLDANANVI